MTYLSSAFTSTADTDVPSDAARSCAAVQSASGTRRVRIFVSGNGSHARALAGSLARDGVRVVRHVDEPVTARLRLRQRDQRGGDGGLAALAVLAGAGDFHDLNVYTAVYTVKGFGGRISEVAA